MGLATAGAMRVEPSEAAQVLFIRGANRSGGFLEAGDDAQRTSQLADINNASTSGGNHGWNTLANTLTGNGFNVTQVIEPLLSGDPATGQTSGGPLNFTDSTGANYVNLNAYQVIVFGSNNAVYGSPAVDAFESYIRGGGGAIFISDANFGSNWADASNSDQPFLSRFGMTMNQDQGTYSLTRRNGEFLVPNHPILAGVNAFDGEGVTPITVSNVLPAGVSVEILAQAEGNVRRNQAPFDSNSQGPTTPSTVQDAVLLAAIIDNGRLVGHFDRNTFFNLNGAGTNITRFDNQQLAINMFSWAAAVPEPGSMSLMGAAAAGLLLFRRRPS